jgi:tRNA dimethylallyltransferase
VLALFGPTGVGKTAVALALASSLREGGEDPVAIGSDALQAYRGLEILTGAASPDQRRELAHRLVGFRPLTSTFSAGEYAPLAHVEIDGALEAGRTPIVVGGTGLYLQVALRELDLRPPPPPELRERVAARIAAEGPAAMHAHLAEQAPAAAGEIAPTDRSRLIRAHELLAMGERPPAVASRSRLWNAPLRHPTLLCGLVMDRAALYERIDARVDAMLAAGVADEVARADAAGASPTARKALGFAELLAGDVEAMKRRTRNYAKRQLTWMRRLTDVALIDATAREPQAIAAEILASAGR